MLIRFRNRLVCSARLLLLMALPLCAADLFAQSPANVETIEINLDAPSRAFPHYWEKMFGSGRAILSLRESYRHDLKEVRRITGFQYVRFHAIFHDEVGLYDESANGAPLYNFSYIDQIYDGLLENQVRPFIELSFMPKKLSSDREALHAFWYKQNVAPPRDWNLWEQLIETFTRHLVERYGENEVAEWYFEVWNEPNIDFWVGNPKESTYYELYDHAARAVKRVSPRLRIGGPATAQAAWADRFLAHCKEKNVPVDFVSTHVYGNDKAEDVFGTHEVVPRNQMVCRAVKKVHAQILASPYPETPLIWSEFNADYGNQVPVTDSSFMGPWMADTIRQCDGMAEMMSYWTFSDVFEEQGVVKKPFYGGFGLLAAGGIPKAAFNAFAMLHQLGDARLPVASDSALVTRRQDGRAVLAVWNYASPDLPDEAAPTAPVGKTFRLHFNSGAAKAAEQPVTTTRSAHANETADPSRGDPPSPASAQAEPAAPSKVPDARAAGRAPMVLPRAARVTVLDPDHGSPLAAWEKMGRPAFPTREQIATLRKSAALPAAKQMRIVDGTLTLTLPPSALGLVELEQ